LEVCPKNDEVPVVVVSIMVWAVDVDSKSDSFNMSPVLRLYRTQSL
jgi:hypothetical protein